MFYQSDDLASHFNRRTKNENFGKYLDVSGELDKRKYNGDNRVCHIYFCWDSAKNRRLRVGRTKDSKKEFKISKQQAY